MPRPLFDRIRPRPMSRMFSPLWSGPAQQGRDGLTACSDGCLWSTSASCPRTVDGALKSGSFAVLSFDQLRRLRSFPESAGLRCEVLRSPAAAQRRRRLREPWRRGLGRRVPDGSLVREIAVGLVRFGAAAVVAGGFAYREFGNLRPTAGGCRRCCRWPYLPPGFVGAGAHGVSMSIR
jgi:hypothetical protein